MDMEEIRYLLGGTIFARAKAYTDRIQDLNCEVAGNGVRHLSADVRGGGRSLYQTQVWLRENGSFVSASCSCPYNENGEGPCCKHIGALLMWDSESQGLSGRAPQRPSESPESIPGVVRGTANLQTPQPEEPPRRDSYASSLEMLFGKKWRGEEPESDYEARRLLQAYQEGALAEVDGVTGHGELRPHAAELEPELTLLPGELPWLRLRISADGGRQYVVKSIPDLLRAVEKHGFISYGKALEFRHSWEAFAPEAQQLLRLLRRQLSAKEGAEAALRSYGNAPRSGPAGGIPQQTGRPRFLRCDAVLAVQKFKVRPHRFPRGRVEIKLHHRLQRDLIQQQAFGVLNGHPAAQLRQDIAAKGGGIPGGKEQALAAQRLKGGPHPGAFGPVKLPDRILTV